MPFVVIAAVVVAIAVAACLGWRAEQQRRQQLVALAARLGLRIQFGDDPDHDDQYAQFEVFRRGHSRAAQNTMSGTLQLFGDDCRLRMGDFRYKVTHSNGKTTTTTTHRFSYLIAHPPWVTLALLVRPEGVFDKLAAAFGFDDIDFESVEFSKRFFVKSEDKRFAYDVLHPRMMEFLLAERPPMIDIEGGALCIADGTRRWTPAQYDQKIEFVRRFCALWPRHLLQGLEN